MKPIEIKKGIWSVGVVDWDIRHFHGYTFTTARGSTYNAYLIIDDKITLVDTVLGSFSDELIANIRQIVPPEKIDYIIANHVETDHSGAMPALMKLCPKAKVHGTAKCKEGLYRYYYENWDFKVVKTGDTLKLGKRTLTFIEAPMIHWPDSMFTYCREEELLLPNDAFGQHLATSERFADEVDQCALWDEAAKYYANILLPFSPLIARKIGELKAMGVPVSMIAPSHGVIWRKDPMRIVDAYLGWAGNETKPKAVIAYETMWGATGKMAHLIGDAIAARGFDVKVCNVAECDRTEVFTLMLDARALIFGSSTHDNDMLPIMASYMEFLKGLKLKNRCAAAFGSYGWGGGAVAEIEDVLKAAGIEPCRAGLSARYMPDENDRKACVEFGEDIASRLK